MADELDKVRAAIADKERVTAIDNREIIEALGALRDELLTALAAIRAMLGAK